MGRLAVLKTLLASPGRFFERREPQPSLWGVLAVVVAVAAVSTAGFLAMGWLFASNVDATVTETTMRPWDETTCEGFAEMAESTNVSTTPPNCAIDEPRTRQVDVGARLWDAFVGRIPLVFGGTILGWLVVAAVLHVAAAVVGRTEGFSRTLAVAGYATVPAVIQTVAAVLGVWLAVRSRTFASDPEVLVEQFRAITTGVRPVATAGLLVATAWQGYVWAEGLAALHDCDRSAAVLAAGVVALGAVVVGVT